MNATANELETLKLIAAYDEAYKAWCKANTTLAHAVIIDTRMRRSRGEKANPFRAERRLLKKRFDTMLLAEDAYEAYTGLYLCEMNQDNNY